MGTTKTDLQNESLNGLRLGWTLVIEGVDYLITDAGDAGGLSGARQAWTGTSWDDKRPIQGLRVQGDFGQDMEPWNGKFQVPSMTFVISPGPDGADTFGTEVNKVGGGGGSFMSPFADGGSYQTEVDDAEGGLLPGTAIVGVRDTGQFSASGAVYLGSERMTYTTTTAASGNDPPALGSAGTPMTRGAFSPFEISGGGNFGRYHPHPGGGGMDIYDPSAVSDAPTQWAGKWCGLWMHRITGKSGGSLHLDGSSEYAFITDGDQVGLALSTALTIEFWVNLDVTTGEHDVIAKWSDGTTFSYRVALDGSFITLGLSADGSAITSHQFPWTPIAGVWQHVAVSWTGSSAICYVNAKVNGDPITTFAGPIFDSAAAVEIGRRDEAAGAGYLNGKLAQLRVWSDVRTAAEIEQNWNNRLVGDEAGLVAHWTFLDDHDDDQSSNNNGLDATNSGVFVGADDSDAPFFEEVWDTKAQAELVFAGTIASISDSVSGNTIVAADDVRGKLRDTVLLYNQWTALPREGIYVPTGRVATMAEGNVGAGVVSTLSFVASPSGANEAQGDIYYTADSLVSALNEWLSSQSDTAHTYSLALTNTTDSDSPERRCSLLGTRTSDAAGMLYMQLTGDFGGAAFLGFNPVKGAYSTTAGLECRAVAETPPLRFGSVFPSGGTMDVTGVSGTWVKNNSISSAPTFTRSGRPTAGEDWGFLKIADRLYAAKRGTVANGITPFSEVYLVQDTFDISDTVHFDMNDESPGEIQVKQVVILEGSMHDIMLKMLISTGGAGHNHATYDEYPPALGAHIPWDLLGDNFVNSLANVSNNSAENKMFVVIEKPTKLQDVIMPELQLRNAHILWKDGGLQVLKPQSPSSDSDDADWVFTENNKATSQRGDIQRSIAEVTSTFMRNSIEISYNRNLKGQYKENLNIIFSAAIADTGITKSVKINARNSYGLWAGTGDGVRELAYEMAASMLPMFARPLHRIRRTMSHHLFFATPGDLVTVTDDHARNPTTGARGLTGKPGMILKTNYNWGNSVNDIFGEVDILLFAIDEVARFSPAGLIDSDYVDDSYDNGYLDGGPTIKLETNEFSLASESADASRFAPNDLIRIIQRDPASSASVTEWQRTVASVSTNFITLTASLSSPGWDNSLEYYVVSDDYDNVVSSQQAQTYMADDADFRVGADDRNPYRYADSNSIVAASALDLTGLPERHADENYGDGVPVSPSTFRNMIRHVNNMTNYKTAPSVPQIFTRSNNTTYVDHWSTTSTTYVGKYMNVIYFGPGKFPGGYKRTLALAFGVKISNAGYTGTIRVTISGSPPEGSASGLGDFVFRRPYNQVEITHTGTTNVTFNTSTTDIDVIYNNLTGIGYMTVEVKTTNGTFEVLGMHTAKLGPLVTA